MLININASAINTTSTAADVQTVTKIQDLSDVDIPVALDNGQLLIWNGSTMNWENSNTVENDLTVTGNMIPYTLRANADTNNVFTLYTTWENFGVPDYDLTTTLTTFKDTGANQLAVHQWRTEGINNWYRYEAIDTGTGDDGSHISKLYLQGSAGEISAPGGSLTLTTDTVVVSNEIIPNILRGNADTGNAIYFRTTWENFGTDIYDLTSLLRTYKDAGADQLAVHQWLTENENGWYKFQAIGPTDDGGHTARLTLEGGGGGEITVTNSPLNLYTNDASMALSDNVDFTALNNFQVSDAASIYLNASGTFEVNVGGVARINPGNNFEVYSGGSVLYMENGSGSHIRMTQQLDMTMREQSANQSTGVNIIRHNSDGGSVVNDSTQIQYNLAVKSEDETVDIIVGGMQASYNDGGAGNRFGFTLNDLSGQNEVNSVFMHESYTTSAQPFQYPSFNQTDINAMSPSNGWVLYNSDTNKLQVYAAGSWVDLH
jgi:hypothetical protein